MIATLIVDDDFRVSRIHAAHVAATDGFTVVGEAHTLSEARDAIATLRPQLVLLDLYLPDGNGLDLVKSLAEEPQRPDVMVITAARDVETVRTAMQLGSIHYVVKPFTSATLRERLYSYRDLSERLGRLPDEADQDDVDELFRTLRRPVAVPQTPRKGHSAPTLELVRQTVRDSAAPISAAAVAERLGVSRPTAQRYLSYLAEHGVLRLELKYGGAGRPEHLYSSV
ncbi:MAG: response regulator [Nocardioidaceae bacterium]|nr:response regulator [Nocardioidaceae bacterium]MCL2613237.1 response regulator [Nocardioidaceae bacterium]